MSTILNETTRKGMSVRYNADGLIPVVVQDEETNEVLMLAYMNHEALLKTLDEKVAWYYSRSRQTLWKKGETSGHVQQVVSLSLDCDQDTILMRVIQDGVACHTNRMSCFFNDVTSDGKKTNKWIVDELYALIETRQKNPDKGAYTTYLFEKGIDKILKKVGEETAEVIIAAKNRSKDEMVYEISDLVYHMLVLMVESGVSINDIRKELEKRREKKDESKSD